MKRLVIPIRGAVLLALALLVAGCASQVAETPAQRVYALQADYHVVLEAAVAYESLPRCGVAAEPPGCSDADVVAQLRRADNHAFDALQAAQQVVRQTPDQAGAIERALSIARAAIGALSGILKREEIIR